MQFKVPQKIDMEDKIVGPLTMKQFLYLMISGMVFYATIKSYDPILIIFVGSPFLIIGLCLAFIKIQDQPFSKFLISLLMFLTKSKKRVWYKDWQDEGVNQSVIKKDNALRQVHQEKVLEKSEVEKLSQILDTRGISEQMEKGKEVLNQYKQKEISNEKQKNS